MSHTAKAVTMTSVSMNATATATAKIKLEQQHSKPILSPTRSLDEGFESDPDRVSTDTEQPTSGTANNSSNNAHNTGSSTIKLHHNQPHNQLQHQNVGSTLAQLSSAATGGLSSSTTATQAPDKAMDNLPKNRVMGPQLTRRTVGSATQSTTAQQILGKFSKDRRSSSDTKFIQNISSPQGTSTTRTTSSSTSPIVGFIHSTGSKQPAMGSQPTVQRLQYQKQRQHVVASAAAHQAVHNHCYSAGGSAHNNNAGFRRARTRAMSPSPLKTTNASNNISARNIILMPRGSAIRSHSVDAIARYQQQRHLGGNNPTNALILRHEGSGSTDAATLATATRMHYYKYPSIATGANGALPPGATTQALLVQPISSATLSASAMALPPATTVLNSSNIGDAAAALVAAAGGSPIIASATNSLYTFYPAEGNLQVWQSECGDLTYKSSRNLQTHKAPVCWTQSIPRQTRRSVKPPASEIPKKVRFSAFATVQVV